MGAPIALLGAQMMCTFGTAPSAVVPTPGPVTVEGRPVVRMTDIAPMSNIPPFAMCTSLANPQVAAATSAALGVLTPMPCMPTIVAPWAPVASRTLVSGVPAALVTSRCTCAWGGSISFIAGISTKTLAG